VKTVGRGKIVLIRGPSTIENRNCTSMIVDRIAKIGKNFPSVNTKPRALKVLKILGTNKKQKIFVW